MTTLQLITKGDTVFDNTQQIQGVVVEIDYKANVASITTGSPSEDELILCKLFNLKVVKRPNTKETPLRKINKTERIKIKYFNPKSTRLAKIAKGDWIDLRASETVTMKAGEFKLIPLGVAMELPDDYEAPVIPRSGTFKNYGILQTNSYGLIDNSYSGDDDQWHFPAYATRDATINFDDRICQFRIQERMPEVEFEEVEELGDKNRGGFGSTGVK